MTLAIETQVCQMSVATIDRLLRPWKERGGRRSFSTTRPGSLLRSAIPIRTFADWQENRPGFVEVDLVAHCGDSVEGQYLNTLTTTDVSTGWTECVAVLHRSQHLVFAAIQTMRQRLPFPLLGLDSDNGGEFINDILYRYCQDERVTFTRSRPYKKNDQAHVEQKNWSVVRHLIGYDRFETQEELQLLNSIYDDLRLYVNFFQPVLKLMGKEQVGKKTLKRYDEAATPYQRVLRSDQVDLAVKARLCHQYLQHNPVKLRTSIDEKVATLWKIIR